MRASTMNNIIQNTSSVLSLNFTKADSDFGPRGVGKLRRMSTQPLIRANASSVSSLKRAFRRQSTANYSSGFKSETSVSNLSGLQRMRSVRGLGQNNDSVSSASKGFFKGLRRLSTMNYSTHGDVRQVSDSVSSLSRFLRRQSTLNSNSLINHAENFAVKNKRVMIDKDDDEDDIDESRVAIAHTNTIC